MIAILVTAALLTHLTIAAYTARWLYGHWRANYIDTGMRDDPHFGLEWHINSFNKIWRPGTAAGALLSGLIWEIALPLRFLWRLASRFMDTTPVIARSELEAEHTAMAKRIRELEQELGYREVS